MQITPVMKQKTAIIGSGVAVKKYPLKRCSRPSRQLLLGKANSGRKFFAKTVATVSVTLRTI
jgi:hypothetical protein